MVVRRRLFLTLLTGHKVDIVALRIQVWLWVTLVRLQSALLRERGVVHEFQGVGLLWSVLWLSLVDCVLVHNEHIISVPTRVLIRHFAGLCCSGGVLLI